MVAGTLELGQIIILNGIPRSGKSSIVSVIQDTFDGPWMNLGVDVSKGRVMAKRYAPGIGLRPGGQAPELETLVVAFYAAMYESIAAHSRLGLHVAVDVGHHDSYSTPLGILAVSARRLNGLPALFVGVRCPTEITLERRRDTWGEVISTDSPVVEEVQRWQREVHTSGIYDLEVDTSLLRPVECAEVIRGRLRDGPAPSALQRFAATSTKQY